MAFSRADMLAAVEYLHLRRNRISDAGARAFATSPHLGGLRGLVLDGNEIGPEGAAALPFQKGAGPWGRFVTCQEKRQVANLPHG